MPLAYKVNCPVELSQVSEGARQTGAALARAEQQSQLTGALLDQLRADFVELFGGDLDKARALAETAAHVRTVAAALAALTERAPLTADALRELLSPLLTLIPASEDPPR